MNDPNDCQLDLDWGFTEEEVQIAAIQRFIEVVNSEVRPPFVRWTPFTLVLEMLRLSRKANPLTDEQLGKKIAPALTEGWANMKAVQPAFNENLRTAWLSRMRLFCVSEVPDQPLMWTHYADQHKGVVLRFVFPDDVDNVLRVAQPVIYRDAPPVLATLDEFIEIHFLGRPFSEQVIWERLFRTKSADFSYEREWRVILPADDPNDPYYFLNIHPREIEAIILGARIAAADEAEIRSMAAQLYPHSRVLKAKLTGYNVVIEQ